MADVDDESMEQFLDQRHIAPGTQDQAFCSVMPGLAIVAQPPIHAAHARQQGQAGRFAGWTTQDSRHQARRSLHDEAKPMATPPRNQTRHKPRQSRILARRGAFRLLTGDQECARTIPHRFRPGIVTAQLPHSRTIPHKFLCRLLPLDAKKCLQYEGNACIFAGRLEHRKAIMSNNENIENPVCHGSNPCRAAIWRLVGSIWELRAA